MNTRGELTELAFQAAGILNLVEDNDERELLHDHFLRVIEHELEAGVRNRKLAATVASVGLDPRDGYALGDVKLLAFEGKWGG